MKLLTEELLDGLIKEAKKSPRLRMNYNFHKSMEDPVHRMLNAMEPDTYLIPHRHSDKDETYILLRGSLITFFFDENGEITEAIKLDGRLGNLGLEIPMGVWHTILVLESGTVIYEIKQGPYKPLSAEDIAVWAPSVSDKEGILEFREKLSHYIPL